MNCMQQALLQICYKCHHGTHNCSGMMNSRNESGKRVKCLCSCRSLK
jgi:hypothetical protein